MQKRNTNIDAVKGLGILLVVLGHNWVVLHERGQLFRVIFSFHMPLFFFLSGIFLNESNSIRSAMRSKAASLLKPYFVVLIMLGAAKYIGSQVPGSDEFGSITYFMGVLWSTGITLAWPQMWFLTSLFLAAIVALTIVKLTKPSKYAERLLMIVTVVLLFTGIFSIQFFWRPSSFSVSALVAGARPGLPWSIDLLPITCAFVLIGYLFRNHAKSFVLNIPLVSLAACAFAGLHIIFQETIDLYYRQYGNPLVATAQAMLGIYLIFGAAALLRKFARLHAYVSYLGSASLFILIFHYYIEGVVFVKIVKLGDHYAGVAAAISFILGITVPLVIWEMTKRLRYLAFLLLPASSKAIPSPRPFG
jgi:fucose 4-O-acetylase-like acetyltransferase